MPPLQYCPLGHAPQSTAPPQLFDQPPPHAWPPIKFDMIRQVVELEFGVQGVPQDGTAPDPKSVDTSLPAVVTTQRWAPVECCDAAESQVMPSSFLQV